MSLRNRLIRLAAERPEFRADLLPLLKQAGDREADFADRGEVDLALGHLTKAQRILRKFPVVDTSELDRLIAGLHRRLR